MRAKTVVKRSSPPHDTSAYFFLSVAVFGEGILAENCSFVRSVLYIAVLLDWAKAQHTVGWHTSKK